MSMGMGVVGGPPVGMNMNNGAGPRGPPSSNDKSLLNTYIYDYFLKNEMFECARSLYSEAELQTVPNSRRNSPSRRAQKHDSDGNTVNGIDENAMDTGEGPSQRKNEDLDDAAKQRGDDLPLPKVPADCPQGSFLFDWWCLFWDIFGARNGNAKSSNAAAYVAQTQATQRFRQEQMLRQMNPQQQHALMTGQVPSQIMNNPQYANRMMQMQAGVMPNGGMHVQDGVGGGEMSVQQKQSILARQAMMNSNRKLTPQQITALKNQQMMVQAAMQRGEGGEVNDMNGQQPRPQSPAAGQNAGSPNGKRLRLDSGQYQEVGNGRGAPQGAPQGNSASASQAHQLLMANGIDPNRLTPQQFAAFQGQNPMTQQKSIHLYAQSLAAHAGRTVSALQSVGGPIPKGMPNVQQNPSAHGSPMMPQTSEGASLGMSDFYTTPGGMRTGGMGAGTGNHALQDYQMQLMLLEQQNKRRLAMARAEQDNIAHHGDGQRRMEGFSQSMSPSSRAAPSPQPPGNPKMAGTPKIPNQAGPGSPMPDGQMSGHVQQRNSPAAMGGFNGQIPQETMLYNEMKNSLGMGNANPGGQPNGATMMRPPPSSHPNFAGQMTQGEIQQMNANIQAQTGRGQPVPNVWQQQQQQQQQQQAQQQQVQQQQLQIHQQQQQQQQQQQALQQQQQQQARQQAQQAQQQAQQQPPGGPQAGQPQAQIGTPNPARQNLPGHQAMPPPSAPSGAPNNVRTQPSSPQVANQQPPTPTQSHKPNPKGKAGREAGKKQRPNKKNGGAAPQPPNPVTPSSEPPTPTTPQHPSSFTQHPRPAGFAGTPGQGGNAAGQPPQQPTPNPAHAAPPAPVAGPSDVAPPSFSGMGDDLGLTFSDFPDNGADTLLDNFDFDSFLNTEDNGGGLGFDGPLGWSTDAVETAAGES